MQLLHNTVLGKRKWLLSSPDELHPVVPLQRHCLIKLEGLGGSPLGRLFCLKSMFPEWSWLCTLIHHDAAGTAICTKRHFLSKQGRCLGRYAPLLTATACMMHREPLAQGSCGHFKYSAILYPTAGSSAQTDVSLQQDVSQVLPGSLSKGRPR